MNKDVHSEVTDYMFVQIQTLSKLIGRKITNDELDNFQEFFNSLPADIRAKFEDEAGPLV